MDSSTKLSLRALIALVIGSMIGSGIFALPSTFARTTGALGAIIAWCIAGFGMLMLAFVFQNLANRKPDLDSGIYAYAKAGFGNYIGFFAALGYWIGCCLADVACLILIKATLGKFWDVFGDGTTFVALAAASVLLWAVHFLVLNGVKEAAFINTIATIAKIIPIGIFIIVVIANMDKEIFSLNFWGSDDHSLRNVISQVRNTMLITVFVFVGIEGASVYSRYAKKRSDVGVATVLGFLGVLCLLMLVTIPSFAVLPQETLAGLPTPSMAGIFEALVGRWGAVFISIGLVISILGNYLSWSLLAAEVLFSSAKDKTMPSFLARENAKRVPVAALLASNIVIQVFLLISPYAEAAFTLALKMTSAMTLAPYFFVALYGFKIAITGDSYAENPRGRRRDLIKAGIASVYTIGMIYAGGVRYLLLSSLLYFVGSFLFFIARREQGKQVFTRPELMFFLLLLVVGCSAIWALRMGYLVL